ncbi:MAG: pantoate--beta-alanine ligase [gamma proteobacterium symbiont of Bathyaustriella thionipta]|nr:pantoate--beta-alanine ligase [gamma proteobacterium symbiont of Bathyaustriella thionipta]MCU7948633.1 pantoate--beta-alanine ligase [gamma proteobacterium symbiont of Bathyaustriella thionipta]MCU7953039.1 pantoate--beta-alanine ligase [gamma proteobacterium symbiont of Bathyaustriella thionipta]MCU7955361.1 pantoate--beta-alanine ligase [gamma proteobacterium symbiont of Bathyaustriella thionipta]MCU7967513.1 pantoate--beta-alanine ligase [gamma proteobacterium symbiont of Bathyaustriella
MQIIHTIAQLRQIVASHKRAGKIIGFVPTMGNLHQGHLLLVEMALSQSDIVICSIFVNPLQFGEGEDFEHYPRTLQADADKLQQVGCDIVFAPAVEEIYPDSQGNGQDQSQVIVPGISDILEGAARPGHFTGVATVVAKLFNMVQPDKAVFGAKDYQQLQVIKRFVRELCFPVEILTHPIVRESNGLAMSSRNGYLSDTQKQQTGAIHQMLKDVSRQIKAGANNFEQLEQQAVESLNAQGFVTDYISIRAADLSPAMLTHKHLVVLAAAYLGTTRLLDNIQITL